MNTNPMNFTTIRSRRLLIDQFSTRTGVPRFVGHLLTTKFLAERFAKDRRLIHSKRDAIRTFDSLVFRTHPNTLGAMVSINYRAKAYQNWLNEMERIGAIHPVQARTYRHYSPTNAARAAAEGGNLWNV